MNGDSITPWMRAADFLRKGPRYHMAYIGWRARRLTSRRSSAEWPPHQELEQIVTGGGPRTGALEERLHAHFNSRRSPRPLCDWSRRAELVARVPQAVREGTVAQADLICARRFVYRGVEVAFDGAIDWRARPGGNTDWTWDLNRHHFFITLGRAYWYTRDERYAITFRDLLREWLAANPPDMTSPIWRSVFEAGVRVSSWCWAHALFLPSSALDPGTHLELLRGILGLGRYLHRNLERHAWNNHLLLEARALSMLGLLYPELPDSVAWRRDGLEVLGTELERQILADGVHSERSSLYHAILSSDLLEHLVVLRLAGRGERDQAYCQALVRLLGMALFQAAITRSDGSRPMLGDASRKDAHVRYDAPLGARLLLEARGVPAAGSPDESLVWLLGTEHCEAGTVGPSTGDAARGRHSRAFPVGGYFVLEADSGKESLHAVFDCGPFGDPVVPGHGHADALSLDLALGSAHLLVDPGMYSAHLGERWRNYFRGTSAHNTVVVDGRDQSVLDGLRRVFRPARSTLLDWASCSSFDVVGGLHLGYLRLRGPVTHRREIFFLKPRLMLVVDRLEGRGAHTHDLHFHFAPEAEASPGTEGSACHVKLPCGRGLTVIPLLTEGLEASLETGVDGPGRPQGWVAYTSGVKEPAPVLRHRKAGKGTVVFATLLIPELASAGRQTSARGVAVTQDVSDGRRPSQAVACAVDQADGSVDLIAARRLTQAAEVAPGRFLRAGDLAGDGDFQALTLAPGGSPRAGVVYRGWELVYRGEHLIVYEAGGLPGHFAFRLEGKTLEVETAVPPLPGVSFRLLGPLREVEAAVVNGKPLRLRRSADGAVRILLE